MTNIQGLPENVVFFDGVCNLCSSAVQFILRRDRAGRFRFASLQSAIGVRVFGEHHPPRTIFLFQDGKLHEQSSAVLRIARGLDGAWKLGYCFIVVPPFLRNAIYRFVARHRYKWFGKKEQCWLPEPSVEARFLR